MGDRSAIEWTEATWNPTTGCDRTSPGCDNCLAPDTPVLMADTSWQPIGKLVAGDEVVGFTESPAIGQNRLYERAHSRSRMGDNGRRRRDNGRRQGRSGEH